MALILDGTNKITATELADDAVTAAKIASGAITGAALPTGSVLQVVSNRVTSSQALNTSSTSYADIPGMTVTITPISTSSTVFIIFDMHVYISESPGSAWLAGNHKLIRGSTDLFEAAAYGSAHFLADANDRMMIQQSYTYTDSPSSTSALTYKVAGKTTVSGTAIVYNESGYGPQGQITAMEVAG